MSRKVVFRGKVYKPAKFGEGIQPGTVDWERARRQMLRKRREEDEALALRNAAEFESEPKGIWRVFDTIIHFFKTPR